MTIRNDQVELINRAAANLKTQQQRRDLSYRVEAVHTSLLAKRSKELKSNQMVESSVENLDRLLTEDERLNLLGRSKVNMPTEL